jgi:hypothetical protein
MRWAAKVKAVKKFHRIFVKNEGGDEGRSGEYKSQSC